MNLYCIRTYIYFFLLMFTQSKTQESLKLEDYCMIYEHKRSKEIQFMWLFGKCVCITCLHRHEIFSSIFKSVDVHIYTSRLLYQCQLLVLFLSYLLFILLFYALHSHSCCFHYYILILMCFVCYSLNFIHNYLRLILPHAQTSPLSLFLYSNITCSHMSPTCFSDILTAFKNCSGL